MPSRPCPRFPPDLALWRFKGARTLSRMRIFLSRRRNILHSKAFRSPALFPGPTQWGEGRLTGWRDPNNIVNPRPTEWGGLGKGEQSKKNQD